MSTRAQPSAPGSDAESLPPLRAPHPLPSEAPEHFRRDGFAVVRGLASPDEVAAYRPALVETTQRINNEKRPIAERDTYAAAFLQTLNLWKSDERVRRFVTAERFARVAAELLGVPAVRLYHDQSLFKEPGGGPTPWHQDQYYWPLDTEKTITLWMPLVEVDEAMGVMRFARGSHREGPREALPIGDASDEHLTRLIAEEGFEVTGPRALRAGDATFHAGWTLHRADGNRSTRMREVMTVIYFEDGARALEPDNPGREIDLACWLPGVKPGEPAASPDNPVLYRAEEGSHRGGGCR